MGIIGMLSNVRNTTMAGGNQMRLLMLVKLQKTKKEIKIKKFKIGISYYK